MVTWPGAGAGVLRLLARGTPAAEFIICVEIDFGRTALFFYVRSKRLRTRKVFLIVLQESIPTQIRQLILYLSKSKG